MKRVKKASPLPKFKLSHSSPIADTQWHWVNSVDVPAIWLTSPRWVTVPNGVSYGGCLSVRSSYYTIVGTSIHWILLDTIGYYSMESIHRVPPGSSRSCFLRERSKSDSINFGFFHATTIIVVLRQKRLAPMRVTTAVSRNFKQFGITDLLVPKGLMVPRSFVPRGLVVPDGLLVPNGLIAPDGLVAPSGLLVPNGLLVQNGCTQPFGRTVCTNFVPVQVMLATDCQSEWTKSFLSAFLGTSLSCLTLR